jgi:hypothetical protein
MLRFKNSNINHFNAAKITKTNIYIAIYKTGNFVVLNITVRNAKNHSFLLIFLAKHTTISDYELYTLVKVNFLSTL